MQTTETQAPISQPETDRQPHECAEPGPVQRETCANCGTGLLGPHCYACGQPVRGMVRHLSSIVGDLFDTLLALDSRIVRTLWPLFARPGFLTREYFAGRRVRYVSPVRLFIFLCLSAFFFAKLNSGAGEVTDNFRAADSPAEVRQHLEASLAELEQTRRELAGSPAILLALSEAEQELHRQAQQRIVALGGAEAGDLPPLETTGWDPRESPLDIDGIPPATNRWLTEQAVNLDGNWASIRSDPERMKELLFGAIPTALFILLPIFALLLRLLYLFERRLYMEHLIVALHSHAALCLVLMVAILLGGVRAWLGPDRVLATICDATTAILLLWMPLYLLLMQKRVYDQGWPMTLAKYLLLGCCYAVLLGMVIPLTMVVNLAIL
ncbi:DUF3667 domain-containing protein [Microbulbifer halophilus]|uniref:DUF3667 domain-containing protein n=1 Tax=Microbulbifer halophilus TaxID=453963 RepID=A0ABW5E6L7_9GAMM|nr:DUF3667 domain-containing protein [Microbulbifer halophilus]MCW8126826.1 DUF3667 domain-containing protein [Microbulbifer halophilus]